MKRLSDSSGLTLRESGMRCRFTHDTYLVTKVKCVLDGVKLCSEIAEDRWG